MKSPSIPTKYLVRVECMTYNHAPYIEDAMNGFCMQETNFPYICVIVDDASTDGEPEVIRNYLERHFDLTDSRYARTEETDDYVLTFARHKTNHNCFFGVLFLKYNHYGRKDKKPYFEEWSQANYIALCEGDDYWIAPLKLQIQVDLLEDQKDFGMCYTACKHLNQSTGNFVDGVFSNKDICSFKDLLIKEPATTLTILFRTKLEKEYLTEIKPGIHKWLLGDTPRLLWFAVNSKICNLHEVTAVYRELPESASHSNNIKRIMKYNKSTRDVRLYFCKLYPSCGKDLEKDVWKAYYQMCLADAYRIQNVSYIVKLLLQSRNTDIRLYKYLIKILIARTKSKLVTNS